MRSAQQMRLLRRRPATHPHPRRTYATADAAAPPRNVAVVGGGITGLTAAYYLARFLPPTSKVTVLEAARKPGGWIETVVKEAPGTGGKVYFENGPRMLRGLGGTGFRADDLVFYDMMSDVLKNTTLRDHPARKKMFYYNDQLFTVPPSLRQVPQLLKGTHVLSGMLSAGLSYRRLRRQRHPQTMLDEDNDVSIADFVRSAFGHDNPAPRNALSAMVHGIYGGSIERLSLPSVLPSLWYGTYREERRLGARGELVPAQDLDLMRQLRPDRKGQEFADKVAGWCVSEVLAFEGGMESLTNALLAGLERLGVDVRTGAPVDKVRYLQSEDEVELSIAPNSFASTGSPNKPPAPTRFDKVIWTTPSTSLALSVPTLPLPTEAVSIRTVSLWYPQPDLTSRHNGFGYLVPISQPNPERVLGVFFDSDTYGRQADEVPGTKITVLMGGHFWSEAGSIPSEDECVRGAIEVARRHLGITQEPALVHANLARDCIPQHVVGHRAALKRTHEALLRGFGGSLAVAGGSYTAVGVMPAMRAGYDVACHVAREQVLKHVGDTGLAQFAGPADILEVPRDLLNGLGKKIRDPDFVMKFFLGYY